MGSRIDRIKPDLPILLETALEMAVVTPAGMATELSRDAKGTSLLSRVKAALPTGSQPKLPHRLDRVSRGIVIVAFTKDAIARSQQGTVLSGTQRASIHSLRIDCSNYHSLRKLVDAKIQTCLDELLAQWENERATRMGGHHA